ncbi:MAG: CCA tRNA nucleotidyltransferase [Kordiimonadaceae bacterium]|nr:CCA tRNA nucleotidyltransferase [Kordiimonadaceae bacterium]
MKALVMMTGQTVSKINPDWLRTAFTQKLVSALGAEAIKFVGGAVRDTLLGRTVTDIDAATIHKPEETMRRLQKAGLKAIPTGLQHGTVTAVDGDGNTLEITTLRLDVTTDGRHAEVAFTESWLEDAKRRDFTFNALYASPDGTVFDPFGGQGDLKAGRVLFIGNAEDRIEEDALRIMRFFRFLALYGAGEPDQKGLQACGDGRHMLRTLSVERIRAELLKLLGAETPVPTLTLMQEQGIWGAFGIEAVDIEGLGRFLCSEAQMREGQKREAQIAQGQAPIVRLYILLQKAFSAKALADWLKLSRKESVLLKSLEKVLALPVPSSATACRALLYKHGVAAATVAAIQAGAKEGALLLKTVGNWQVPSFPLQGRDMLAAGFAAGPEMGQMLKAVEATWIESDFSLSKDQLLATIDR